MQQLLKITEKERYWFWERHFAPLEWHYLSEKVWQKIQSSGFFLYCSDMIFFQSQNFGHGKFLSVCKSYTAYAKIFQLFSAFHLNKIELYILLFTERSFISKYKHIFLHFCLQWKLHNVTLVMYTSWPIFNN